MAKIEPLTDPLAFVDLLEKSNLLDADAVAAIRKTAGEQPDAGTLARQLVKDGSLTKWQAYQLLLGTSRLTVSQYRLLDQIGKGPLGRVYLAEHGKLGKKVALKVLSARFSSQPEVLKRFLEEANRAGALNHRNILHIFDAGSENERYYLVVEYVEGKDLQRTIDASGPLNPARATDLVRQAAEGLAHAHEQQLTHGDLKPSNLLIDATGVVKILDLGLSGLANLSAPTGSEESTEAASLASLAYRAPELLASNRPTDVRSDLYSLGAVLHFLLTGKPPSANEEKRTANLEQVPGVGPELLNLCDHLLAADPAARPESAAEVVAALELAGRALPAQRVEKLPEPSAERPSSAGKPKRPLVAKPLEEAAAPVIVETAEPTADVEGDPLAGFSIKTGRKKKAPTASPAAAAAQEGAPTASAPATPAAPASKPTSRRPLILAAAIGGGVLVLAALVTVVVLVLNRGGNQELASADQGIAKPGAAVAQKSSESKAAQANSDANPELNPEVNPPLSAAADIADGTPDQPNEALANATKTPPAQEPTAGGKDSPAAAPMPSPMPMPAPPTKSAPGETKPGETKPGETKPSETKPGETKPTETKTDAAPAKTPPAPAPAPAANPFEGFDAAVALPALEAMGKPAPDALAPAVLGPVKIEPNALCIIKLKGGETAFRGKSKFSLEPAEQGTAERDWEFKLQNDNDPAVVIATMSLKDDQLSFQWTEPATSEQAAAYLGNCVLTMAAGAGTHQVALRKPVTVEPLAATVERGTISEKYNLDYPPGGKEIAVEIGPLEGGPASHKVDPKTELEAFKDTTYLFAGTAEDALLLGFKIDVSMPGKTLQITAQPQFMLSGMPRPERYLKNTLNQLSTIVSGKMNTANLKVGIAKQLKNADQKKKADAIANSELEMAQKGMAQVEQLKEVAKQLQEGGAIHFRAYYLADDAKVELISTGGPPAAPPMPMPDAK